MPLIGGENQPGGPVEVHLPLDPLDRLVQDPLVELLPLGVVLLEPLGDA
jgi:hypothetical protein